MAFVRDKKSDSGGGFKRDKNQQGWLQQAFDVRNADTGESYIYGNKPDPTGFDDVTRIMADTGTRGWGSNDKMVAEARERTPGYVELPADAAAILASSPYRIGSTVAGGAIGGAEGALRSYGNQEGWMPEWGNIGKDAAFGAALGSGGYALPKIWNAAKSGLQKFGNVSKLTTGLLDYAFMGAPVVTGASTGAKVVSKLPALPTNEAARDALAKTMITMGPR